LHGRPWTLPGIYSIGWLPVASIGRQPRSGRHKW